MQSDDVADDLYSIREETKLLWRDPGWNWKEKKQAASWEFYSLVLRIIKKKQNC